MKKTRHTALDVEKITRKLLTTKIHLTIMSSRMCARRKENDAGFECGRTLNGACDHLFDFEFCRFSSGLKPIKNHCIHIFRIFCSTRALSLSHTRTTSFCLFSENLLFRSLHFTLRFTLYAINRLLLRYKTISCSSKNKCRFIISSQRWLSSSSENANSLAEIKLSNL